MKMIRILECLLQTQIHSGNTHAQAKHQTEYKATWQSELLKNLCLGYIFLELIYHRQVMSLVVWSFIS